MTLRNYAIITRAGAQTSYAHSVADAVGRYYGNKLDILAVFDFALLAQPHSEPSRRIPLTVFCSTPANPGAKN